MNSYKTLLYTSVLMFVASGILYAMGLTHYVGFSVAAAFLLLSIAVKYTNNYKAKPIKRKWLRSYFIRQQWVNSSSSK